MKFNCGRVTMSVRTVGSLNRSGWGGCNAAFRRKERRRADSQQRAQRGAAASDRILKTSESD